MLNKNTSNFKSIKNEELKKINGGGLNFGINIGANIGAGISAAGNFAWGFIDGFQHHRHSAKWRNRG